MAKRNYEYKTHNREWSGPDDIFVVDLEIDTRLEAIAERLSEESGPA
jgi:hypothetical protein